MNKIYLFWIAVFCFTVGANGEYNPYLEVLRERPWASEQGYLEVRPGAFLFYWLYYADGATVDAHRKPLVIWIQGGPGIAASGVANFAEIGPLDMELKPRNHTWVNGRNVLLIDHPVTTGFSYVKDPSLRVKTDRDMALDLSKAIKGFFRIHKKFRRTPTYLFGQSYGGKICPRLAFYLHTAIEKKRLKMNFKGVGIGSAWVDPKESSLVYPEYFYHTGLVDQITYQKATGIAKKLAHYLDQQDYENAAPMHGVLLAILTEQHRTEINLNNINQESPYPSLDRLAVTVNKYVKPALSHVVNQTIQWSYVSEIVLDDFYRSRNYIVPSTKFLEMLLNNTQLKIAVYNGNLDVITPLSGASNWIHKLKWHGANEFKYANRYKIRGHKNGFYKVVKNLSFWWVFGSGHWVPEDNPTAMQQILDYVISGDN